MAKLIKTISIGNVREIRRTFRIDIQSPVNAPVVVTIFREVLLCDEDDKIISQKTDSAFTRTIPGVENEIITLPNGTALTAEQVAAAIEMFCEKWDDEILNPPVVPPAP